MVKTSIVISTLALGAEAVDMPSFTYTAFDADGASAGKVLTQKCTTAVNCNGVYADNAPEMPSDNCFVKFKLKSAAQTETNAYKCSEISMLGGLSVKVAGDKTYVVRYTADKVDFFVLQQLASEMKATYQTKADLAANVAKEIGKGPVKTALATVVATAIKGDDATDIKAALGETLNTYQTKADLAADVAGQIGTNGPVKTAVESVVATAIDGADTTTINAALNKKYQKKTAKAKATTTTTTTTTTAKAKATTTTTTTTTKKPHSSAASAAMLTTMMIAVVNL